MQPFNPLVGLLTLIREVKKWWSLEIQNEGDLLDMVLESPQDLDRLRFKWTEVGVDMGHDGVTGSPSEAALDAYMENLGQVVGGVTTLNLTLFPTHLQFHTLDGLITSGAGRQVG